MNPILKWAGGKRKLVPTLHELMPKRFSNYHEPMIGGGAMFFSLNLNGSVNSIGDMNRQLVTMYRVVKQQPEKVWAELSKLIASYKTASDKEAFYYKTRKAFNTITGDNSRIAAMMLFLNRTCYNGLWRTNKNGAMNVPWNKNPSPAFPMRASLQMASRMLQSTEIVCGDFADVTERANAGDFVYLDPPYIPEGSKNFTAYTADAFHGGHERVANIVRALGEAGVYCMVSNRATATARGMYDGLHIHEVRSTTSISQDPSKRGKWMEFVITNYEHVD